MQKLELSQIKRDKGTAGLVILLSLVTMIFVIGLLVMIFTLMASSIQSSTTDNASIKIINDTKTSISGVTTYFPLFITIGAMVVLILLTVLIIVAIRSSGLISSGTA